ncbi:MAG: hypothetical protein MJZ64_07650 [Paludibacteraceae bacterium]|nr:hypothetical protein [Paludibacteraceae bacterium]
MQHVTMTTMPNVVSQPVCGLEKAMADIAAGRINHYSSLAELINKFK